MAGSCLLLVANNSCLSRSVQAALARTTDRPVVIADFPSIRERVGQHTAGLLLLAADGPGDCEQVIRLVQEVRLQQLPLELVVLAPAAHGKDLSLLDEYLARRLRWPDQASGLAGLVAEYVDKPGPGGEAEEQSLAEVISRRLLAQTPSLQRLVEPIALAATHDVPVLLTGETGTGKTYLARLMHDCSSRKHHRFLVVSCGALSASLIESEFFGHTKGAFTSADQAKEGKFAAAGHGTLLLDEIDTLGLEQQANLLRVIETGEFEPVGSNQTHICTARIIVASNWDLEQAVDTGKFRRDLYYRLHVLTFHLPPLRERLQDIEPLVRGIAARYNTKFRRELFDICPQAMTALKLFPWPGNIRQLENVIQQAVLVSAGPSLLLSHLPQSVQNYAYLRHGNGVGAANDLLQNRAEHERRVIERALKDSSNSRTQAARALGISRVTLYKKMRKYGLMDQSLEPSPA
ncbi:MAG TPA: sigma 54-interacting transcriptional regulator [Gemmataceae bacterium]|nr:sigma 54-interacting transcriptional regulator [Gemmataceae bacterium]